MSASDRSSSVNVTTAPAALSRRDRSWTPAARRTVSALITVAAIALLGVAAWLEPSPTGLGTHMQIGAAPCGWIAIADVPCPTCGMTTAFAHAANGDLLASARAQPLGMILAVATAMAALVCLHIAATGSRLGGVFARMWSARTAWALAAAVVLSWLYKIAAYKGWT